LYLNRIRAAAEPGPRRAGLSCGNLAHGFAACGGDKPQVRHYSVALEIGIAAGVVWAG
jgi:phosphogluconate dehydratase